MASLTSKSQCNILACDALTIFDVTTLSSYVALPRVKLQNVDFGPLIDNLEGSTPESGLLNVMFRTCSW